MKVTTSSKYSLTPLNRKYARAGRIERFVGGKLRLCESGRDSGDSNLRETASRLDEAQRRATIASGEMYPE